MIAMAADPSAYQHALGKSFNDLPPVLRSFAGAGTATYSGSCTVTRGSTGWSRFVGLLMGLPRKAPQAAFSLDVDHAPHRCIWIRQFPDSKKLKTSIKPGGKAGGGIMVETVGAATLTFQVSVDDGRLLLVSRRGRFLGLPLPGFMAPRTEASIGCDGETILVESTVTMGRRSRLMRYTFEVTKAAAREAGVEEAAKAVGAASATAPASQAQATSIGGPAAEVEVADDPSPVSQQAPRPADADARTVPISKADERGLRAELEARTVESRTADTDAAPTDAADAANAETGEDDDATAVLGRPSVDTVAAGAEDILESESQRQPHPLDADRATVPVSASKVRRIPRKSED